MQQILGEVALGGTIPPNELHAISVGLPTWETDLGWGRREEWVVSKMNSGYPRLADVVIAKFGNAGDDAMLFPSRKIAELFIDFVCVEESSVTPHVFRVIELAPFHEPQKIDSDLYRWLVLYAVIFPAANSKTAKAFWQHTGEGISSRRAEFLHKCLADGGLVEIRRDEGETTCKISRPDAIENTHVASKWIEQRRIREKLRLDQSVNAKRAIAERIARAISSNMDAQSGVHVSDVYLYASGMSTIFNVHRMLMAVRGDLKSVCYGFSYVDTAQLLVKFGAGCLFYGYGNAEELDDLEKKLQSGERYSGFFCEFPSNPLLGSPDLERVQKMANEYDLIVIVDETVGTFFNVDVLSYADIVCTSLSKIFSGACNVMGGSIVLNARRPHYTQLKAGMEAIFVDDYFPLDSVIMDYNSRDFESRISKINSNAEALCDILLSYPSVKRVYYPKCNPTREFYDKCRRASGGYGYLLTVLFHECADAIRFLDALDVPKGPSLGTNFTLASPYTLLAHFWELEWAAQFGVVKDLVRISVGMENIDVLIDKVKRAMNRAKEQSPDTLLLN